MGTERMYGPPRKPCKCGKGTVRPYRVEHDTYPTKSDYFPEEEIDCEVCDPEFASLEDWERGRKLKERAAKR
jgi:hypothetical protein